MCYLTYHLKGSYMCIWKMTAYIPSPGDFTFKETKHSYTLMLNKENVV